MPVSAKQVIHAPKVVLNGAPSGRRTHTLQTARAATVCAGALPPALFSVSLLLLVSTCMDTATLICALVCTVASTAGLGAAHGATEDRERSLAVPLLATAAAALAAMLVLPDARAGLYALVNGLIDHFDTAYSGYVPYLAGTETCARSPLFGACLGVAVSILSWAVVGLTGPGVTLIAAVLPCAVSLRLGLGAAAPGCVLAIGAWIARGRVAQLPGTTYSLYSFALNTAVSAGACILLMAVVCAVWTPAAVLSELHGAISSAYTETRYGHDTLPEGDLTQAASMNTNEDGSGLTITYTGAVSSDLYLRGFTGATFANGIWSPLDHTAYEGEWHGMASWLAERGFTSSQQRSAFDDAAAAAGAFGTAGPVSVEVDASAANRRYVYAPYTLRELDGTSLADQLEGSLSAGIIPAVRYTETIDTVDRANVLAATDWLASSTSSYAQTERVYAAFVTANYLAVDETESEAVHELIFNDASWNHTDHTDYEVIARVRTVLQTLASYTEAPEAPNQDGSFVRWLLEDARKGNSAYFATAAVLAFRSQGIPARYTEGYLATTTALAESVVKESSLTLTARNAHAWAEIYLDGIGWTPVEVTPGFYTQALNADKVIDVGETWSAGSDNELGTDTADAAEGGTQQDDGTGEQELDPAVRILAIIVPIPVALGALVLIAQTQRSVRIARRRTRMASGEQDICVPALYAHLAGLMRECSIGFDEDRPLDCAHAFDAGMGDIDEKEYRRVIELYQSFTFGGCTLRPNELRTLRRFNERLHSALPAPDSPYARLHRRFVCAL